MWTLRRAARPCVSRVLSHPSRNVVGSVRKASSVSLIKDLRSRSGAPMVECKKALEASEGDLTGALDWLRQHGVAKASSKTQGRDAPEGLVGLRVAPDGRAASLVKVSSETDFAGRSEAFVQLVTHVADATLETNETGMLEKVLEAPFQDKTVQQALEEAVLSIRENLSVPHAQRLVSEEGGRWVGYVHGRVEGSPVAGTAAALVHVSPKDSSVVSEETLQEAGKKLAMHVVAAKPLYLSPDHVPEEELNKERSLLKEQMADSGKPPHILEKIVTGRMRKFYEGVCLTEQAHMVEVDNPKVSKVLDELGIVVTDFYTQSVASQ